MSSVQNLRELINERLTATAEEIFREFEKTIVQYEEEIDRQRRLLDIIWKPETHTVDLPQQYVCQKKEVLADKQRSNRERNSSLDQENSGPVQIKEEQEDLSTSQEGEPLVLKQEADMLVQCKSKYLLQQHVCTEQMSLAEQLPCNQERNSSLDKEDLEAPQIKEEQEELCTNVDGEQLVVKLETDIFMVTPTNKESDHKELEQNSDQLLSHNSPVAESPHDEQSKHIYSGSTKNAQLKPKSRHHKKSNHSNDVDNTTISESNCDTDTSKKCVKCDVCGKAFKDRSRMNRHYKIHTGVKPYACSTCGKRFYEISPMRCHERIHTGEKLYPCKICRKKFSTSSHLKVHLRIHTGEKQYSCELCGKSFRQSSGVNVHMRTHTGEKKHSCKICDKKFGQNSHLIVHMRTHTGEKLYFCEICGKNFSQSSHLIVHVKTHKGAKSKS
ncbi:zinc finger protein 568-like isoform X2 [Stegastes partitus]|uniref:Zinc finger protein 568-like isoform X2 n=1 Tax=Stegastes partitus TaxID=144197 RepID=A0A9Y4JGN8_9TELE|nr:PREDICTED: zinc finger protein 568-like isoform X2 [Stegastes partitus]